MRACKKKPSGFAPWVHIGTVSSAPIKQGWIHRLARGLGKSGIACPGWSSHREWPRKAPNLSKKRLTFSENIEKRPFYSLSIGPVFSSLDGPNGWPVVVVSREQHVQDDPHTGIGQERLPTWSRSDYLSVEICKKKSRPFYSLSIGTVFSALIMQGLI